MSEKKQKVFVALSGGVDSSAAAAILLEAGYDCKAVFMITSDQGLDDRAEAKNVAEKLGLELIVLDCRSDFEKILDYFRDEYAAGRTPNPCVRCNRQIKFGKMLDFALAEGADFFATGHYARILKSDDGLGLYAAANERKDQSYALAMIKYHLLKHLIFPMGDYSKDETRKIAARFGLSTEQRTESQEICFIPDNDYAAVLERTRPELVREGKIIDSTGRVLGGHNGIFRFTIGQRRGPGVAMGQPFYVTKINADTNTVILGPREELMHRKLSVAGLNWLCNELPNCFQAKVKIRYNSKMARALVSRSKDRVVVEFDEPASSITPGQLAAIYIEDSRGDKLLGGGWIEDAFD